MPHSPEKEARNLLVFTVRVISESGTRWLRGFFICGRDVRAPITSLA
jgi:hypothetical protein